MTDTVTCPSCNTPNPAGAKFCAGCGKPLFGGASNPPPPPPPPPPPSYTMGAGMSDGLSEIVSLSVDDTHAWQMAVGAIAGENGTFKSQLSPSAATFVLTDKRWYNLGANIRFNGDLQVKPTPEGSKLKITLGLDTSSIIPMMAFTAVAALFGVAMGTYGMIWLIAIAISAAYTWWSYATQHPKKIIARITSKLSGGMGPRMNEGVNGMNGMGYRPQPQAAPQPRPQAAPQPKPNPFTGPSTDTPSSASGDPFEQLKKLAGLRDIGAISPEEFEAKKAEIMTRI